MAGDNSFRARFMRVVGILRGKQRQIMEGGFWGSIGGTTDSGAMVDQWTAQKFSSCFRCVKIYKGVICSLPLQVKAQDRIGKLEVDVEYLQRIIVKSNSFRCDLLSNCIFELLSTTLRQKQKRGRYEIPHT